MNPVEIEQALSDFAETPFEPIEFPYGFLACFGRKANELKSLRSGTTNKSDLEHAVLLRNAVHICVCPEGEVTKHLATLRQAPETAKWKAKLALATDGQTIEAENIITGETFVCDYTNLPDHFGALPSFQKYRENDLKKIHYQQRWRPPSYWNREHPKRQARSFCRKSPKCFYGCYRNWEQFKKTNILYGSRRYF